MELRRRDTGHRQLTPAVEETLALACLSVRDWVMGKFGASRDEAHDIAVDATVAAFNQCGGVISADQPGSYVRFWRIAPTVAARRALNLKRDKERAQARESEWQDGRAHPSTPHEELERAELGDVQAYVLAILPEDVRAMFLLNAQGMPPREIAPLFGVTPRRASDAIARARAFLAPRMRDFQEGRLPAGYRGYLSAPPAGPEAGGPR